MDLKTVALEAARDLEGKSPQEILRWAADTFGDRFCVSSSMGDGVLSSLAASVKPGIDVVFLDTGYHFPETIGTRDAIDQVYDVKVRTMLPLLTVTQQDAEHGKDLWRTDPDRCCAMRKVEPLNRALEGYDAYASGVRRDEAPSRAETSVVEWDDKRGKVKVNPLAAWTQDDVDAYVDEHGILVNPLAYDGYPSIGCAPCTHRVAEGEDPRSGRWKGSQKTECGLHV
ncbi:MAG: phosphoadenosine phosphosulfate reductase [Frankiales bacterium]|nr:phosphoadenosine phosphosulfate reductase [Frankiales bacterium]